MWHHESKIEDLGDRFVVVNSDLEGIEGVYLTRASAIAAAKSIAWKNPRSEYRVKVGGGLVLLHPHQPTKEAALKTHRGGKLIWVGQRDGRGISSSS